MDFIFKFDVFLIKCMWLSFWVGVVFSIEDSDFDLVLGLESKLFGMFFYFVDK